MRQYCRYCAFCFEADDFRCSNHPSGKQPHWTRAQINKPNNCPNFALSDLGDVETGRAYKERQPKPTATVVQLTLVAKQGERKDDA